MKKLAFLFAAFVAGMLSANAKILMYDGFPYGDGAYKNNGGTSSLKKDNQPASQFTTDLIFGFDPNQWTVGTGVLYSLSNPSLALALPESFSALPSASYVGNGSAGGSGDGGNDERAQSKKLSSDVQSALCAAEEFHFRCLMSIGAKALNSLANDSTATSIPNSSAFAAGLMATTDETGYGAFRNLGNKTARTLCFAFRRAGLKEDGKTHDNRLSLVVRDASDPNTAGAVRVYDLVSDVSGDTTYICYARVVVDTDDNANEKIYAFAQPVSAYDRDAELPLVTEADLVDKSSSLTHITFCLAKYSSNFIVDEFALATDADDIMVVGKAGAPSVSGVVMGHDNGSLIVSGTVTKADAENAGALLDDGAEPLKFSAGAVTKDAAFEKTVALSELTADKTYDVNAYVENSVGSAQLHVGYAYSGVLTAEKLQDANEYKLVPGKVQVSRAHADPFPLTVNYEFTSDKGTPGVTWVEPEGVVTIPAGEASAVVTLQPLQDKSLTEDATLTFSILDGAYLPVSRTVDVKLENLAYPEGYNIWIAEENGLASDAANWSKGRVPTSEDSILIDGEFSSADMAWDAGVNGLPAAVKSWTMRNGVGTVVGTVTIPTAYSGDFTCLTVNGDMEIGGGQLTQAENGIESETYRLRIDVKGDFTLGENGLIDVTAKGPKGSSADGVVKVHPTGVYGSYGGDVGTFGKTYGDPKRPYECGNGHSFLKANIAGGGAVWIEVVGVAQIDGRILSNNETWNSSGVKQTTGGSGRSSSGGAVYLEASEVKGAGTISVAATSNGGEGGSGGRLAIWSKDKPCGMAVQNLKAAGFVGNKSVAAGGTVVVRNPGEANGTLIVRGDAKRAFSSYGYAQSRNQTTTIPAGATWIFDAVVFGDYGVLTVGEGATLNLPNGFQSISSVQSAEVNTAVRRHMTGLVYRGGTLNVPAISGVHAFKGGVWTFLPAAHYELTGQVSVSGGANVGMMTFNRPLAWADACDLKIVGDLIVASDGTINADASGLGGSPDATDATYLDFPLGAPWGTGHGGQNAIFDGNVTYDSFFSPNLVGNPAGGPTDRYIGGGLLKIVVTGEMQLDGVVSASSVLPVQSVDGTTWNARAPAAGSVNLTVGSISGSGSIMANGALGRMSKELSSGYGASGGGRVSVRLTGDGSDFSQFDVAKITAKGATNTGASYVNNPTNQASAGSVYLQAAAEGEKCGTIVIRNDGYASNPAYTPIPSAAYADAVADFKKASLSLLDCGKVRIYETLQMANLTLAENCQLDLNGNMLTVNTAKLGDTKLKPGTYAAGATALGDFVIDSVGGGSLVVKGTGMVLLVR